ncbi:MAG: hypothetical protein LBK77_06785 [Spirochaetaceae bacterium]|jgi:hypothetical protein|nr:hypothetical protein [Spirochaetaceae bacterium]
MKTKKTALLTELLADRFSDTWRLLSETSRFLSRTPVFYHHEDQLRVWRRDLQNAGKNAEISRQIREEVTELRKSLRRQGYDLSLAKQNLVIEGFRNDTALAEGFRRVVLFFAGDDIYWLAGDDNHITLAELLERQLDTRLRENRQGIRSRHYLWYRRKGNDLVLSGSDTEMKDDFERLKAMAKANNLVILAKLKGLK